jgi:5-methylcytosine-specific restriction endonuclease McrA
VDDPHITLNFDNFQRLCQDCHAAVHSSTPESRVTFDENGNIVWKETDGGLL